MSEHEAGRVKSSQAFQYPTRLIDLGEVGKLVGERVSPEQVRLVLTKDLRNDGAGVDGFYVTLSHVWGKDKVRITSLTEENHFEYQNGISLASLPRTFQDAIHLARRLDKRIRYIWIDSLCIMQSQRADWLSESAQMYQIYRNAYCNISATAATDGKKGLYRNRERRQLWEDYITLNIEGIPGQAPAPEKHIQCRIENLLFWEQSVDEAPVNKRGWVLQERLLAPRVLHFCQDQIAWECRERVAAESSIGGYPIFRPGAGDIELVRGLMSLVPHQDGKALQGANVTESDPYKCWQRVVERYSKTKLTEPSDKLIALSGIANTISRQIDDTYIAGMWKKHLASQLLWRVDPVYENGKFKYLSERPKDYRAPTFSWAAVEAERGIKYGEFIDQPLLIEVKEVEVKVEVTLQTKDEFGVVKEGYLILSGLLKKIEMDDLEKDDVPRYHWHLKNSSAKLSMYKNVCLDSPKSDSDIFGPVGRLYCMPAREDAGYLICLLLQLEMKDDMETGNFRRIGVTKIPLYTGGKERVLELWGDEAAVPYGNWDAEAKKHTVCIV
jgi:hypothetical protein